MPGIGTIWLILGMLVPWTASSQAQDLRNGAQPFPGWTHRSNEVRVVSRSGQFVFYGETSFGTPAAYRFQGKNESRPLDPGTAAIAAERLRQGFQAYLRLPDQYQGRIHVVLSPNLGADHMTTLVSTKYPEGWQYQVQIASRVGEFRFVRAITQALLQELANREASSRAAEIPTWLSEGLSLELLRLLGAGFSMQPDVRISRTLVHTDGLQGLREFVAKNPPMTFEAMSLSSPSERDTNNFRVYQASAECLTLNLLRPQDGPARMVAFLKTTPQYWNWQTAFFQVYQPVFPNMLAIEKWWSLVAFNFPREPNRLRTRPAETLAQLESLLTLPGQVQVSSNSMPMRAELTLQQVISEVPFSRQQDPLSLKVTQLTLLELNSLGDLARLIGGYRTTLSQYLDRRLESRSAARGRAGTAQNFVVAATIRQLDQLDRKRHAMLGSRALTENR